MALNYDSGIWVGQRQKDNGQITLLKWSLTLTPNRSFPSAFGSSFVNVEDLPHFIKGTWSPVSKRLDVVERDIGEGSDVFEYYGVLQQGEDGSMFIQGPWSCKESEENGFFVVRKEEDDEKAHVSGLWVGKAEPDESLADFYLPTNPIRWSMSVMIEMDAVFGCGYFQDAGDVPNHPVLFFIVKGRFDKRNNTVEMVKIYEETPETAGYTVDYNGDLEKDDEGYWWMNGKWRNEMGGSFGNFTCRLQPASSFTSLICLCDVCHKPISPGENRWNCTECLSGWSSCDDCLLSDDTTAHPHELKPEAVYNMETAFGSCSARLAYSGMKKFGKRPFLGFRNDLNEFTWITYSDVFQKSLDFYFAMKSIGIESRDYVLICSDLSVHTVHAMLGSLFCGCIIAPIHGATDSQGLSQIIELVNPSLIVADEKYREKISIASGDKEHRVVVIDSQLETSNIFNMNSFLELGKDERNDMDCDDLEMPNLKPEDVTAILFTSGSTGVPKGAMFPEDLVLPSEGISSVQPYVRMDFQPFDPSFILSLLSTIQCGGCRAISSLENMMDDFKLSRPTHLGATPVFWNGLYQEYLRQLGAALSEDRYPGFSMDMIEHEIGQQIRLSLGNRLFAATSGGAPLSDHVLKFVQDKLKIDIVSLYGTRETGGIARDGLIYPQIDVKLLSIPEMGYFNDDVPPRGEICVNTPRVISGYLNNEEKNAEAFVEIDGKKYYRTGDVGELFYEGNERRIRIIDRSKFVFKLAQGEWIAPSKIENILEGCPWIEQILILGNPSESCTVAVVVPSQLLMSETTNEKETKDILMKEIRFWCHHHHIRPIETPRNIKVKFEKWDEKNGFLTSTLKKKRIELCKHYSEVEKVLYEDLSLGNEIEVVQEGLSDDFINVLANVLPRLGNNFSGDMTLTDIGGDSLSAARLFHIFKEKNMEISFSSLFEYPLSHLSDIYSSYMKGIAVPTSYAHEIAWANEWKKILYPKFENYSPTEADRDIFVTGCTGFLGPVLIGEILQQYPESRVYCLVRGSNTENAKERLQKDMIDAFKWDEQCDRLVILCGDLTQEKFGLDENTYNEMRNSISDIYHSGARVNMTLPYSSLKGINVDGSVMILNLAATSSARVHYVSTVGVMTDNSEDWGPIDPYLLENKGGYGQSKAVAEMIFYEAYQNFGLDVRVYRPSAISGDTVTGFSNVLDFTNLQLQAVTLLGKGVFGSLNLRWIPVDFVAKAIVLSSKNRYLERRLYHLTGHSPTIKQVLSLLNDQFGYNIKDVSLQEWRRSLSQIPEDSPKLLSIKSLLSTMEFHSDKPPPTHPETQSTLESINLPWPEITDEVIATSLTYLISSSFLPQTSALKKH